MTEMEPTGRDPRVVAQSPTRERVGHGRLGDEAPGHPRLAAALVMVGVVVVIFVVAAWGTFAG